MKSCDYFKVRPRLWTQDLTLCLQHGCSATRPGPELRWQVSPHSTDHPQLTSPTVLGKRKLRIRFPELRPHDSEDPAGLCVFGRTPPPSSSGAGRLLLPAQPSAGSLSEEHGDLPMPLERRPSPQHLSLDSDPKTVAFLGFPETCSHPNTFTCLVWCLISPGSAAPRALPEGGSVTPSATSCSRSVSARVRPHGALPGCCVKLFLISSHSGCFSPRSNSE